MRPGGRRLTGMVTGIFIFGAVLPGARADVEGGAGQSVDGFLDGEGKPTAEASEGGDSLGGQAVSNGRECQWRVLVSDDQSRPVFDADGTRLYSKTGRWLGRFCDGVQVAVGDAFAVPEGDGTPVDPAALARRARESVEIVLPRIATSPSADRRLYAQVATWLWVEGGAWAEHSATASAGAVSATVTARPLRTVWSTGDGHEVVCEGPGVRWREGMEEDDTYCSHTYRHSSAGEPDGTYTLSVTVRYGVSWTSNVGEGGELAGVGRSASRAVEVGEIQAVEAG